MNRAHRSAVVWIVGWLAGGWTVTAWAQALPASTIFTASSVTAVLADDTPRDVGDLVIRETVGGSLQFSSGGIVLSLPSGVQFARAPMVVNDAFTVLRASVDSATYPSAQISLSVSIPSGTLAPGTITLTSLRYRVAPAVGQGNIMVSVTRGAGGQAGLTPASVANAQVVGPSLTVATTSTPPPFAPGGISDGRSAPDIQITEGAPGSVQAVLGGPLVTLTLPAGVTFNLIPAVRAVGLTRATTVSGGVDLARREFRVTVTRDDGQAGTLNAGPSAGRIEIANISLAVDGTATPGPVVAQLNAASGSNIPSQSVTLGDIRTTGVLVTNLGSPVVVTAGRTAQGNLPIIRLEEVVPLTLLPGSVLTVQTPTGVKFNAAPSFIPNLNVNLGGGIGAAGLGVTVTGSVSESNTRAQVLVTARGPEAGAINIAGLVLDVDFISGTGPIQLTVSGTGMAAPVAVPVATIRRATTSAANPFPVPAVRTGRFNQPTAGVRITEAFFGALETSATGVVLAFPQGVVIDSTPSASVSSGNLTIGTVSVPAGSGIVRVPITAPSASTPSALDIGSLSVTVPANFPVGPLAATVRNGGLVTPPVAPGPSRPTEESVVIGYVLPETRPAITEPTSGATIARGAPVRIAWTVVPQATQYGVEYTGAGRTFSNPQGTTVDASNGFGGAGGGFIVGNTAQAAFVVPATAAATGSYQIRVIGLTSSVQPIGTFSDAVTIQLM